jgi:hypothetical protein
MTRFRMLVVAAIVLVCGALALDAGTARADSPHFNKATASLDSAGNLICTFKESGLGTTVTTDHVSCSADASALYQCWNNGGKHPQAGNKETVTQPVSGSGDFAVRNGSASGSITVAPPGPGSFTCPNGQTLFLESVTYTNITLTGSGGEVATVPSSLSSGTLHTPVTG